MWGGVSRPYHEQCYSWGSWARNLWVALGKQNLKKKKEATEQVLRVVRQVPHPQYNRRTNVNDLMLLQLSRPVRLGQAVRPITVAQNCASPGTSCLVSGWGTTSSPIGEDSCVLMAGEGLGAGVPGLKEEEVGPHIPGSCWRVDPSHDPSVPPQPATPTLCSA